MPGLHRRWLAALYASKITPAARDTLTAYGQHMDAGGVIRVDVKTVQEWTGRGRATVARHLAEARSLGLLEAVGRSAPGRPAVYRATVPARPKRPERVSPGRDTLTP